MRLLVALLAKLRCAPYQCSRVNRSMSIMADSALLEDRLVLPQERAAFLGMAGITIIVDRNLPKFRLTSRLMCLMTVIALHLAMAQGMPVLPQCFRANICVA
jgi:hypothetical protein